MAVFEGAGEVARLDVADMHEQVAERPARLGGDGPARGPAACAVVAVATGAGHAPPLRGARRVRRGRRAQDEPVDLRAARRHPLGRLRRRCWCCPTAPTCPWRPSAPPSCPRSRRGVVPTRAPQEGLAALLAFDPQRSAAENAEAVADGRRGLVPRRRGRVGPRGSAGPLRARRRRRLRRRRARGVGRPGGDAAGHARARGDGRGAGHLHRGRRRAAGREAVEAALPEGVELELHDGGQPPGGGCCAPSEIAAVRPPSTPAASRPSSPPPTSSR